MNLYLDILAIIDAYFAIIILYTKIKKNIPIYIVFTNERSTIQQFNTHFNFNN